ncbi:MAG: PKD domain-containing protein, partial [Bacteroidota bacterium]
LWQGTSISAPIVAGAVALTLGKYPQYTGVQAAQKVRVSAQSIPHASFQLDKVGKGRLDMFNAIIPDPTPSVRTNRYQLIDENGDGRISGGDTVLLEASFLNYLDPTSDLEISVSVPVQQTPFVQVLSSQTSVGALGTLQAFQSGNAFKLAISQNLPVDYLLDLKFQYTDPQTGYDDFEYVQLRINPSWLNVEENQLHTTITSQGLIGFKDFFSFQEGIGLLYQNNRNILSEGGFLIATSANQVSNFLRTSNQNVRDNDFNIVDFVQKNPNPYLADFEASSTFADDIANQSIGMTVHQKTFAWSDPEYQRFVILLYEIENNNAVPISNLNAGLFTDFDIITQQLNLNRGNYDLAQRIIYTYDAQTGTNAHYGLKLLSEDNFYARALGDPGLSSFSDQAKFLSLTNTPTIPTASAALNGPGQDVMTYIGTGPINLMSGQKDTVAFALVVGDGLNDILTQSAAAQEAYDCILKGQGPISPFTIADPTASAGVPLQFQDNNPNATTWQWDFGDGTTATSANPQHTYSQHGRYTVSLKVSDGTCHFESQQSISVGFADDPVKR